MGDPVLPLWTIAPFALLLLAIAAGPLISLGWWHRRYPWVSLGLGLPIVLFLLFFRPDGAWGSRYVHTLQEYLSFLILLGALYMISGGVLLRGHLVGSPFVNTALLALGTALASVIGTTGASMLLIRPLLQANRRRTHRVHTVVFFIFLVSNIGGCLTPLGDPPLFLGFLRGVPFGWTLGLAGAWAGMSTTLLTLFFLMDYGFFRKEKGSRADEAEGIGDPLGIEGAWNLLLLAGVVATVYGAGKGHWGFGKAETLMLLLGGLSWRFTPRRVREANAFSLGPIREVAILFAGIFATMAPAQAVLESAPLRWPGFRMTEPWQFFWATGGLSAVLDNAPTYLSFSTLASGLRGTDPGNLGALLAAGGGGLLTAISLGAVWMGAMTYIGNGPNFMVKAIAEEAGVDMPSFLGYLAWSSGILLPLFFLASRYLF